MTKLNQVIAVVNGKKSRVESNIARIHQQLRRTEAFVGLEKTYEPKDDEGEQYPGASKKLQLRCEDLLKDAADAWTELFDVVLTQETSNQLAGAEVVVNGTPLLTNMPVTYLLFLEKRLADVRSLIHQLPVLDPVHDWMYNKEINAYVTVPAKRTKTKKVDKYKVVVPATPEHAAIVRDYTEDVVEGYWNQKDLSGAISETRKRELLQRVDTLTEAVKMAREKANGLEIQPRKAGQVVFDYLFGVQPQT